MKLLEMKLDAFKKYSKYKEKQDLNNVVWSYTRVSSKEQYEKNSSLRNQQLSAKSYAQENGYNIAHEFGGTYESAKGDFTRTEFKTMIDKIRKAKRKPLAILIFKMSRFSRSGSGGITVVHELINDFGIHLIETSSGKSTMTARGKNDLLESLVDAERENINRLEITRPGMVTFLKDGNWLGNVPFGYNQFGPRVRDISRYSKEQRIVLNDHGKIVQKAWKWKLQGFRDYQIIQKLKSFDMKISKQKLSAMWRNPFYCGICTHAMLEGEAVRGNWDKMVSEKDFMKVQKILEGNNSGYKKSKVNAKRPLTGFVTCKGCGGKLTSYEVKLKGLHYYSCQNKCKDSTLNAHTTVRSKKKGINDIFKDVLSHLQLSKDMESIFKEQLKNTIEEYDDQVFDDSKKIKKAITKLEDKKDTLERRFVFDGLEKDLYSKYKKEIEDDLEAKKQLLSKSNKKISNLEKSIEDCVSVSKNLNNYWGGENIDLSLLIQKLLFPDGISFDAIKRQYLTTKINSVFTLIASLSTDLEGTKKGTNHKKNDSSLVVAGARLERTTFGL